MAHASGRRSMPVPALPHQRPGEAGAVAEHQPTTFGEGFAAGARFYPTLLAIDLISLVFFVIVLAVSLIQRYLTRDKEAGR